MGVFVLDNDVAKFQGEKITSLQGVFVSSEMKILFVRIVLLKAT